ncbi:MAG: alpha/beta fold hydrolase [Candidatus Obscuribacterales bacterium]|nr:alpha/beta fold hydrolase [Candidatus Obscuribacterales bacterium]
MPELKKCLYKLAKTAIAVTVMLTASTAALCAENAVSDLERTATAQYQNGDLKDCLKTLKKAFKALPQSTASGMNESIQRARLLKLQGDCFYQNEKYGQAIELYNSAITEFEHSKLEDEVAFDDCLNALAGSYVHQHNFDKAAPVYEKLVQRTEATCGANSVQLIWAYLDLINIYRELKRQSEIDKLRNGLLEMLSANVSNQDIESSRAKPAGASEQRPLPLILWRANTATPKAMVIAVHGLGLHCASFQKFAERLNAENVTVCAMDVRGFGSWRLAKGREELDLRNSINDVRGLVKLAHLKNPDVPVFILGESMGGALVLRYAAEYPDTISGVISCVPADRRYKEKRDAFRVAINLVKHPNKPMSVENVLSRAATLDSVSPEVLTDPMMRVELSPKELLKFQLFMRETTLKASQIKNCPVLMVQGMKDRLAKPGASIDIYNNIASEDRNLYLVGECQHLIFEEVDTPDVVFKSVMVWLNNRIALAKSSTIKQTDLSAP